MGFRFLFLFEPIWWSILILQDNLSNKRTSCSTKTMTRLWVAIGGHIPSLCKSTHAPFWGPDGPFSCRKGKPTFYQHGEEHFETFKYHLKEKIVAFFQKVLFYEGHFYKLIHASILLRTLLFLIHKESLTTTFSYQSFVLKKAFMIYSRKSYLWNKPALVLFL